jgi:N-acyl-D-amino-acid deacylase
MRVRLPVLALLLAFAPLGVAKDPPVSGKEVAEFRDLDKAVLEFMQTIDASAATVAVSKDGTPLHSRGFGYADANKKKPAPPDALFRIASVSKPVTSAMVKAAIRDKKLDADAKAFDLIGAKPPGKQKVADERIADVTVAHLLEHKGGWDTAKAGDLMFKPAEAAAELKLTRPLKPVDVISYALTRPLQFDPGSKEAYSNFGYCVLGRVLETVHKKPYADCLNEHIAKPLGVKDIKVGFALSKKRDPREVWYPVPDDSYPLDVMDAHGGLIASAPALCKFLDAYWVTGDPREKGQTGDGTFFGSLPGTTAMVRQRADGYNVAVLFNNRRPKTFKDDNDTLKKVVDAAIDGIPEKK